MVLRFAWFPALSVFSAAARHQNFARAADELHLTASAVSHHIRKLEQMLGVQLFQRQARGVAITPAGRLLADAAVTALDDLESAVEMLRGGRSAQRLRLTATPAFSNSWLAPRLPDFSARHPQIRISVDSSPSLARFEEADGPELGIRYGSGRWPGLAAHHLFDDALFPAASPRLEGVKRVTRPAQIAQLPLIADLLLEGWREWFRSAGVRGVRLAEMHQFSDSADALKAAAAGLGVMLTREWQAAPYLEDGRLIRLPGEALKAGYGYYLVHSAQRRLSKPAALFTEWLRGEMRT